MGRYSSAKRKPAGVNRRATCFQADRSWQSRTSVTIVALAGSGVSDCRNVATSSFTQSSTARASPLPSGNCLAIIRACRRCHRSIFITPSPHLANRGTGFVRLVHPDRRCRIRRGLAQGRGYCKLTAKEKSRPNNSLPSKNRWTRTSRHCSLSRSKSERRCHPRLLRFDYLLCDIDKRPIKAGS
jgi:hypothetical protein